LGGAGVGDFAADVGVFGHADLACPSWSAAARADRPSWCDASAEDV
jgi:hypothetical protein